MSPLIILLAALQAAAPLPAPEPFGVGERFDYAAKLGILTLGSASIQVIAVDTLRGQPVWYLKYTLDASAPFFRINSSLESWTSVRDFRSLRFRTDSKENSREYLREYEIFADSGYYRQRVATATTPTTAEPLDDANFLFFVRSTPLEVGQTYRLSRHFKPEVNPIVIRVLKREVMDLPDGTQVSCLVLNPVVGTSGLFGDRADGRIWLTDDPRRIPVQIRTRQPYGTVTLKLEHMAPGKPAVRVGGP